MRHRKRGRILSKQGSHRHAAARNFVCSLFRQFGTNREYIFTTLPKAKEWKPLAERMITLGKAGDLHSRRLALSRLHDEDAVRKLFDEIAPRYINRQGGYLRILRTSSARLGDGAYRAYLGFLGTDEQETERAAKFKKKGQRSQSKS